MTITYLLSMFLGLILGVVVWLFNEIWLSYSILPAMWRWSSLTCL